MTEITHVPSADPPNTWGAYCIIRTQDQGVHLGYQFVWFIRHVCALEVLEPWLCSKTDQMGVELGKVLAKNI